MRHIKKRWLGLASASVLAMLALSSPAYATNYTCDGGSNPVPVNVTGTVNINLVGENCVIDHDVTATGSIFISTSGATGSGAITTKKLTATTGELHLIAPNNAISTKELNSGWHVKIEGDSIDVDGSITGQTAQMDANKYPAEPTFHANMLIRSQTNVTINGNVSLDGGLGADSVKMGGIQIDANLAGGNSEFVIGGSGASGVTGYISTQNTIGGGSANNIIQGGVRITNGTTYSTGGIRVIDLSNFKVKSSESRAGNIILEAQSGTLTLPAGMLDARGTGLYGGGIIQINAKTIEADDDTILTTSQDADADPTFHKITIASETVKFKGDGGLKVLADGDGLSDSEQITIGPWQSNFLTSSNNVNSLLWTNQSGGFLTTLSFEGAGAAPLVVRADGSQDNIGVYGYPVKFEGGDVTIRARGATAHNIQIGYQGDPAANILGLSIDITGDFLVDTNGEDGNGGKIIVKADQSTVKATNVYINASGPTSGDGDSGTISWKTSSFALDSTTRFSFIANAASAGSGNSVNGEASAILLDPGIGALALGTEEGQINFSARGGSTSGNGGKVTLKDVPSAITVYGAVANAPVVDVSVPGTTGNGGAINITTADALNFASDDSVMSANAGSASGTGGKISIDAASLNVAGSNAHLVANGRDMGKGGEITIKVSSDFAVANGNGTVSLEARNVDAANNNLNGNADGGTIDLTSGGALDLYSAAIGASGGQKGGSLKFKGVNVILSGDFTADGGAQGDGGSISIEGDSLTLPADVNTIIGANGNGSGNGGEVILTLHGQALNVSGDNEAVSLQAKSNESGDGGSVTINSDSDVNLNGAAIDVSAGQGSGGNGGNISVTATNDITLLNPLNAAGGCDSGNGGTVTLTGGNNVTTDGIDASAGDGDSCMAIAARSHTMLSPHVAGNGNGKVDGIVINAGNEWVLAGGSPSNPYRADGSGSGHGGTITINNTTAIDLHPITTTLLSARGGSDGGAGGKVSITNVMKVPNPSDTIHLYYPLDVLNLITVDAGSGAALGTNGGIISINGQACRQYLENGSWPKTVWDCTTTEDDPSIEALIPYTIALSSIFDGTRTQLSNANTQIFLFAGADGYDTFFRDGASNVEGGLTYRSASGNTIYNTVWRSGSIGASATIIYSIAQLQEVSAHELGHSVDITYSPRASGTTLFGDYLTKDISTINYLSDGVTKRDPCVTPMGGPTAPFDGVIDPKTGLLVCMDGVLNNALLPSPETWPSGTLNTTVLITIEGGLFTSSPEISAQGFAFEAIGAQNARPFPDGVFQNGYFPCVRSWVDAEQGASGTLPTSACTLSP